MVWGYHDDLGNLPMPKMVMGRSQVNDPGQGLVWEMTKNLGPKGARPCSWPRSILYDSTDGSIFGKQAIRGGGCSESAVKLRIFQAGLLNLVKLNDPVRPPQLSTIYNNFKGHYTIFRGILQKNLRLVGDGCTS